MSGRRDLLLVVQGSIAISLDASSKVRLKAAFWQAAIISWETLSDIVITGYHMELDSVGLPQTITLYTAYGNITVEVVSWQSDPVFTGLPGQYTLTATYEIPDGFQGQPTVQILLIVDYVLNVARTDILASNTQIKISYE